MGWLGYRRQVFAGSGAAMALTTCLLISLLQSWVWCVPLAMMLSSIILAGSYRAEYKRSVLKQSRAHRVGWEPVLSRVGWAILMALLDALLGQHETYYLAFLGALAVGAADVYASELGLLSLDRPRLIVSGRPARPGQPGAISVLGMVAALGAAWLVGLVGLLSAMLAAWLVRSDVPRTLLWLPLGAMIGGIAGCLLDSFLGATAQGVYYCRHCDEISEEPIHACGASAQQVRGWSWLTNVWIDWVSSIVGAAIVVTLITWV